MTEQPQEIYDETFVVRKQRWGTFVSYSVADDRPLITSLTLENCVAATRFYLKGFQEDENQRSYDSFVDGKL